MIDEHGRTGAQGARGQGVVAVIGTAPASELPSGSYMAIPGDVVADLDSDFGRLRGIVIDRNYSKRTVTMCWAPPRAAALITKRVSQPRDRWLRWEEQTTAPVIYLFPKKAAP